MMENRTIYQVDAFTDEPFKGNPAGVMIIADDELSSDRMQQIAMEMNLSETAFIFPDGPGFRIRFFTPTAEVPLCGHATLASAHIIYELGLRAGNESIRFTAEAGELLVRKEDDWISMHFPEYPLEAIEIHEEFKNVLGFQPVEMYSSSYHWVIVVAASEEEVLTAAPDFEAMISNGLGHLMITAKSDSGRAHFVVRCFAPMYGINEDPVTGSAHCALTPLWSKKLGITEMESLQLSHRTGRLKVKLEKDGVGIQGKALTVFKAQLFV